MSGQGHRDGGVAGAVGEALMCHSVQPSRPELESELVVLADAAEEALCRHSPSEAGAESAADVDACRSQGVDVDACRSQGVEVIGVGD